VYEHRSGKIEANNVRNKVCGACLGLVYIGEPVKKLSIMNGFTWPSVT